MPENDAAFDQEKKTYDDAGWCRGPQLIDAETIGRVRGAVDGISRTRRPEVVYESGTDVVRAVHGCHLYDDTSARLVRFPLLVRLAESLVGDRVYVYQFKVNLKQPHDGAAWPWHQDYAFWKHEDGMADDHAVNIAVLLDEAHEDNGPLLVLPGTHRLGLLGDSDARSGDWRRHVSADLEYTVPWDQAAQLERDHGRELLTGPAGSVFAFHPSIVHSSSVNSSADRRAMLLITYNAVHNAVTSSPRPGFLVGTDIQGVIAAEDDQL
ncbi:phytanoyl-CoA dioxygenase family protein [Streptacidiphilus fuscans]|uniref:Phytanoyl-CoA dioxygenase family protein n=1 Tax=Streptacidiphilus fuscans TaxID=2789292 RepID=A0A931B3T6_9ACTN|nr:phytanoyl-CoA dioxygenase family protein [Streptacidiphilus fuscans]MBF9069819.1 phytanoyl-CoA dioxygenase family protein [Streptacidiphilus fuscans]